MLKFLIAYPELQLILLAISAASYRYARVPADRKRTEVFLAITAVAMPVSMLCQMAANALSVLRPYKLDLYIFRFDQVFGAPSFWIGKVLASHPILSMSASFGYSALSIAVLLVFAAQLWLVSEEEAIRTVKTFFLNCVLAVPIYLLVPVCGPAFAFPDFPFTRLGQIVAHPIALTAAPNGVPSVHTSTALLICFFAWRWPIGRVLSLCYLGVIIVATLGSGQHYLFDLLIAVPYTALIVWLGQRWKQRVPELQYALSEDASAREAGGHFAAASDSR